MVQPNSAIDEKGSRGNTRKLVNSPLFLDLFRYLSFFPAIGKEAGRRWEIVRERPSAL
jgi:hypothetical protein